MGVIRTVTGDIPAERLGWCHAHEHILVRAGGPCESFDKNLTIDDYVRSKAELTAYKAAGGCAIIDAQPVGAGRKPLELRKLSTETGVSIVASTGFHMRKFYPAESWIYALTAEEAEELFLRELTEGMVDGMDPAYDVEKTDVLAGQIKTALPAPEEYAVYDALFTGAARASVKTGAPIMVHTEKRADVTGLLDKLTSLGVAPGKVIVCHLDRTCPDFETHLEVLRRGSWLDYDTVARYKYHDDETECRMIAGILEAGLGKGLLLGLDTTAARLAAYGGTPGLPFIREKFTDIAAGYGIPETAFTEFMINNPKKAFLFGSMEEA